MAMEIWRVLQEPLIQLGEIREGFLEEIKLILKRVWGLPWWRSG